MLFLHDSSLIATFVTAKDKIVTMARPISAETANKVTLHINGGYRYASTRPRVVNEATGKNTNKSIHWGTVTEDLLGVRLRGGRIEADPPACALFEARELCVKGEKVITKGLPKRRRE